MSNYKRWTEKEIEKLKEDYGVLSPSELEYKYQCSYHNIRSACTRYGIKSKLNRKVRKWNSEEIENFINDWKEGLLTSKELEVKYNRQYNSLKGKAKDLKIIRSTKVNILNETDIKKIINMYLSKNMSSYEIANIFSISQSSALKILKDNFIEIRDESHCKRKYTLNENYFDNIDTQEKAYFLGFLYADGYNHLDRNTVVLNLKEEDKHILESFAKELNYNGLIRQRVNKTFNKTYCSLNIHNKHISEKLNELGVFQAKTFKVQFPVWLDENLYRDFLRGYIDGDGCIATGIRNNGVKFGSLLITGTLSFVTMIQDIFIEKFSINKCKIKPYKENSTICNYSIAQRFKVEEILDWLYCDASLFLTRKYDKYKKLKIINKENIDG